ncbi:MAG TPA: hypothetical protein VLM42_06550 [Bryobacteraceae bacterium]|nr:hypothetical protein [Bryobacteraceae bacterium]
MIAIVGGLLDRQTMMQHRNVLSGHAVNQDLSSFYRLRVRILIAGRRQLASSPLTVVLNWQAALNK